MQVNTYILNTHQNTQSVNIIGVSLDFIISSFFCVFYISVAFTSLQLFTKKLNQFHIENVGKTYKTMIFNEPFQTNAS